MTNPDKRPPEDVSLADLTEAEMEMVKNWHLPDVEDEFRPAGKKTTALGRSVDWYYNNKNKEPEVEEEPEEFPPLTAEEIEEIRKAAYEEGLLQGHNEGFEKGHAEGVEKGHIEGVQQGHEQGVQQGIAEGQQIIEAQALRWQVLLDQLANPLHELNETVEKQLVELSVLLAEAVIEVEVLTNQEVIFQTLKETIAALPYGDSECEISLNPLDVELIKSQFSEQDLIDKGWHIKSEPVIEQGGCIVESRTSSIDRTLRNRVKATLERFLVDSGIHDDNNKG